MDKLAIINSIDVVESSGNGGELEYVYVANTPENIEKLKSIGASDSDIQDMHSDGECIDISVIGFTYSDAKYFSVAHGGFIDFVPEDAPEWVKEALGD